MKRVICVFLAVITMSMLFLAACHTVQDDYDITANPKATDTSEIAPTFYETIPPETALPKQIVSEPWVNGLSYIPQVWHVYGTKQNMLDFYLGGSQYPDMKITVDLSVDVGVFRIVPSNEQVKQISRENGFWLYWEYEERLPDEYPKMQELLETGGAIFAEVIIRADGHIVGYGIYEIGTDDGKWFGMMRCETVCFPMIDGELQEVSEAYVLEKIEELKQIVTPFDREEKKAEMLAYIREQKEQQNATEPTEGK